MCILFSSVRRLISCLSKPFFPYISEQKANTSPQFPPINSLPSVLLESDSSDLTCSNPPNIIVCSSPWVDLLYTVTLLDLHIQPPTVRGHPRGVWKGGGRGKSSERSSVGTMRCPQLPSLLTGRD